jgi:hypothetical protein
MSAPSLGGVDLDDGVRKGFWGFLGKVLPDTTRDESVGVLAGRLST